MPIPEPANQANPFPPTLEHVIGQRNVVERLKVALEASFADNREFPHTLLLGPPGVGKTTLAQIIAAELAVEIHEGLGQSLAIPEVLNGFLLKPQDDKAVLFVDEIHGLTATGQTALYRAMENREVFLTNPYSDTVTKLQTVRFTLIAATTDPQFLLSPLRDRFKLTCQLEPYSEHELAAILRQRSRQLGWIVEDGCLEPVARRSFGTPRIALRLLESAYRTSRAMGCASIQVPHLERAVALEQIDECGLGPQERKYLGLLLESRGPVRLGVLAAKLKASPATVSRVVEERLLYLDFIERLPSGRVLSLKGMEHLDKQNRTEEANRAPNT